MPDRIYLPPDQSDSPVVEVGGDCYERTVGSGNAPTVSGPDDEFDSCIDCNPSCEGDPEPCGDCCFSEGSFVRVTWTLEGSSIDYCSPIPPTGSRDLPWTAHGSWLLDDPLFTDLSVVYGCLVDEWELFFFGLDPELCDLGGQASGDCCGTTISEPGLFSFTLKLLANGCCKDTGDSCVEGADDDCDGDCDTAP